MILRNTLYELLAACSWLCYHQLNNETSYCIENYGLFNVINQMAGHLGCCEKITVDLIFMHKNSPNDRIDLNVRIRLQRFFYMSMCCCTGSGWDGVNIPHSSRYGDVFWVCG